METIKVERYSAYKDSGVEWIGEVPGSWEVRRLKFIAGIKTGYTPSTSIQDNFSDDGIVWAKPDNLNGFIPIMESNERVSSRGLKKQNIIPKGSVLVCGIGTIGKFGIAGIDMLTNQQINSIIFYKNLLVSNFGKYLIFSSESEHSKWANGNVVRILNTTNHGNIYFPIPPLPEQTRIAAFLDRKTAQIDQAIAQKERLIELLKERRQILIHNAVTRGLNPDVKMKDSGVEWIGEVPEHWEVRRLKFLFKLIGGGTPSKERKDFWDGDIPWVSPKDMKSDFIYSTEDNITKKGLKGSTASLVSPETLLMVVRSGILQRTVPVAISKTNLTINQDIKAFIPIDKVSTNYLFYFIQGNDVFLRNDWVKQGATVESIEIELLKNGIILIPPKSEQDAIDRHVDLTVQKIATAISLKQSEIEKLKEYKSTLINSAVTGKIKV